MSISSLTNRNDYVGNNSTDEYDYTFRILSASDLRVTVRDTDDIEDTLVLNTDYTVDGVGEEGGGTVTLTAGNLATGYALTIRRVRPLKQETDIRNQGPYFPETVEDAFDHTIMVAQQLQDQIDRCVKLQETDYDTETFLPVADERANQFLGFDANGVPIAAALTPDDVLVTPYMETVLDDTTASAARTTLGFSGAGGTAATANIEDLAVTTAKLAANAVTTAKITDLNVTTAKINDAAVTNAKLGLLAVGSGNIANGAVGATQLASDAVTTVKIADANVTKAKLVAVGQQVSSSSGAFTGTSASYADVTNLSVTITTSGRPVFLTLVHDGSGVSNTSYLGIQDTDASGTANFQILRDATTVSTHAVLSQAGSGAVVNGIPVGSVSHLDVVAAGTYTYKVQYRSQSGANGTVIVHHAKLVAFEL